MGPSNSDFTEQIWAHGNSLFCATFPSRGAYRLVARAKNGPSKIFENSQLLDLKLKNLSRIQFLTALVALVNSLKRQGWLIASENDVGPDG